MKYLLLMACAFSMSGCLVEVLTTTAIQGELASQNAQSATRALNAAKSATARNEVNHALQVYRAEHGAYPPSLEALVPEYLPRVPTRADGSAYAYDPATGALRDGAASFGAGTAPFTAEDRRNMQRIEEAIYDFWLATGRYPRDLDDLDPIYIDRVPKLSTGGTFVYEQETGAVYHPSELAAANSAPMPLQNGAGRSAETTGGLGVRNDRRDLGARAIQGDYSERQMNALGYLDQ